MVVVWCDVAGVLLLRCVLGCCCCCCVDATARRVGEVCGAGAEGAVLVHKSRHKTEQQLWPARTEFPSVPRRHAVIHSTPSLPSSGRCWLARSCAMKCSTCWRPGWMANARSNARSAPANRRVLVQQCGRREQGVNDSCRWRGMCVEAPLLVY
jgi:hypothetical protein